LPPFQPPARSCRITPSRQPIVRLHSFFIASYIIVVIQAKQLDLFQAQETIIRGIFGKNVADLKLITRDTPPPVGAAVKTVSDEVTVYLIVKGFVNFDEEIAKLQSKLEKSQENLNSWIKKTEIPDYTLRVSAEIREQNQTKIKNVEAEIEIVRLAMENFLKLKD
jgi:valyl-tRNA synthetase